MPIKKEDSSSKKTESKITKSKPKTSTISKSKPLNKSATSKDKSMTSNKNKFNKNNKNNKPKFQNNNRSAKDKVTKTLSLKELDEKTLVDLRKLAESINVKNYTDYKKSELIIKILEVQTQQGGNIFAEGVLEVINDGTHGILRSLKLLPGDNDIYVSGSQIKRFNLKPGDFVSGQARPPKDGERYLSMIRIEAINTQSPEKALSRPNFKKMTPIFPEEQILLETEQHTLTTRAIDLLAPIGKGQRGMVVSPPKSGKTWILKDIANGIKVNNPDIHLIVVLVGERPEEVTDMERSVDGEVVASNFDEPPENHTKVAEMALARSQRLVEQGKDVVILMDSLTRLARAYNITAPPSGRTLSGGFDPVALYPPKKFFGAARNLEEDGSLTIIATALVETGSRMDEVIFEEFKGTGNMELKLDRRLAQRRFYPAIDVKSSSTRNEDKLFSKEIMASSWRVRRMLDALGDDNATEILLERLKKTKSNKEFLATLHEDM